MRAMYIHSIIFQTSSGTSTLWHGCRYRKRMRMNKCAGIENPTICNHCQGDVVGCPIRGERMFSQNNIENHIRSLEYLMKNGDIPIGSRTAVACAIRTLREEIPKRPDYLTEFGEYVCPECGGDAIRGKDYCADCGQKLEWSWE